MKVAVIGGGSTYTPELFDGLISSAKARQLPLREVVLMDINPGRLRTVAAFCRRMAAHKRVRFQVKTTTSLERAVKGSSFVLTQLRVGLMQARHQDILLGHKYDMIGQETTGIGGFAKALRTAPVIGEVAKAIIKHAPDAWLVNFTNPVAVISQVLIDYYPQVKFVGLCNCPKGMYVSIAKLLRAREEKLFLDYIGLNHLSWIRAVYLDGKDVTRTVLDRYTGVEKMKNIQAGQFPPELVESLKMIPNSYLFHYYDQREMVRHKKGLDKTRAEQVMEVEEELLKMYRDPKLKVKPESLSKRGGAYYSTVAINLMESIHHDKRNLHVVNVRNNGSLLDLPENASVEVDAVVGRNGIWPLCKGHLPESIRALVSSVKTYEIFAARAAVEGDLEAAYLALLNHPLVPDARTATSALRDLLKINRKHLPQFRGKKF